MTKKEMAGFALGIGALMALSYAVGTKDVTKAFNAGYKQFGNDLVGSVLAASEKGERYLAVFEEDLTGKTFSISMKLLD